MEDVLIFERDIDKVLSKFCEKIRNKYFPQLAHAHINYVFRTAMKKDDEGNLVAGEARKLSNRERDLYGYDFEICFHKDTWENAGRKERRRLAWHELNHCIVKWKHGIDEPRYDKAGRLVIALKKHDIVIKTFKEEIEMFGPSDYEKVMLKRIGEIKRKITRR